MDQKYRAMLPPSGADETEFCSDSYYEELEFLADDRWWEKGPPFEDNKWEAWWDVLTHSIETESRYFNHKAQEIFDAIFDDIEEKITPAGRPVVVEVGPAAGRMTRVFRARSFQNMAPLEEAMCRPDRGLGPPPRDEAREQRMSARGISIFYGATKRQVAVVEVRPPVGSIVLSAEFELTRSLRLLNLSALDWVQTDGSIFDHSYKPRRMKDAFLRTLRNKLCSPALPEFEPAAYYATQAVADFLANRKKPALDGILYPSTQAPYLAGNNVALFQKASLVEQLKIPKNTMTICATSGFNGKEGWDIFEDAIDAVYMPHAEANTNSQAIREILRSSGRGPRPTRSVVES